MRENKVFTIIETFEFQFSRSGNILLGRAELLKLIDDSGQFRLRTFEQDLFAMNAVSNSKEGLNSTIETHEAIWIERGFPGGRLDGLDFHASSEAEAIETVREEIEAYFEHIVQH